MTPVISRAWPRRQRRLPIASYQAVLERWLGDVENEEKIHDWFHEAAADDSPQTDVTPAVESIRRRRRCWPDGAGTARAEFRCANTCPGGSRRHGQEPTGAMAEPPSGGRCRSASRPSLGPARPPPPPSPRTFGHRRILLAETTRSARNTCRCGGRRRLGPSRSPPRAGSNPATCAAAQGWRVWLSPSGVKHFISNGGIAISSSCSRSPTRAATRISAFVIDKALPDSRGRLSPPWASSGHIFELHFDCIGGAQRSHGGSAQDGDEGARQRRIESPRCVRHRQPP